ncbi:MAG TPA: NADH-quinone oxidoreductase subunit H [Patescibacteria group bacterium]|nr:NADH-quinone oxidoreductase subunit H [Patescibacteria group bacterium]
MILIILKFILLPLLSPLMVGIVRKVKALMQNRQGARIYQPYFDLWKLFHKDEVISPDASWIFFATPYILFGLSILVLVAVPVFGSVESLIPFSDFLVVIYMVAAATFFLALSGIDVGSAFGGFGSSREMTLAALTEGVLLFALLPVALLTHTTNLALMATYAANLPVTSYFAVITAFLGYIIAMFSETGRIPFDNPATHLELTMIHEAMILEYSGKRLALIEWASANKLLFFALLGVNMFFPKGLTQAGDPMALLSAFGISVFKTILLLVVIAVAESSVAKFRLFRLPDILLTGFILGIIAILVAVI